MHLLSERTIKKASFIPWIPKQLAIQTGTWGVTWLIPSSSLRAAVCPESPWYFVKRAHCPYQKTGRTEIHQRPASGGSKQRCWQSDWDSLRIQALCLLSPKGGDFYPFTYEKGTHTPSNPWFPFFFSLKSSRHFACLFIWNRAPQCNPGYPQTLLLPTFSLLS